ncbi:Uma2 family endonuclease [Streptomyces millisiae]|uniref:Uma2 family endonuclease n=1 Tax=Streptomyces millisiae TaxID=3075542 RepID=A0ABU2LY51_9ACTN|nr:Uma2 family endonuclease [Streptomyces sp. DSM 44918]MDT0322521.1 Uma2 family endonuclease [Streptomyces sp. DSM 44918]
MSVQPDWHDAPHTYDVPDPEKALKYAIQHIRGDRTEIVEGVIQPVSPMWDHENAADLIRDQLVPALRRLNCAAGSGNLDLPGSPNWYVPDLAVVPRDLAKGAGALLPSQTLLIIEVTSDSNAETDRVVKRRRYAEYGAPLYLLVDRQERACTLFSQPGELGYTHAHGPLPFGVPMPLPAPFDLELDTTQMG